MKIEKLKARKILNSNGNWTIECQLTSNKGQVTASVPTGISTGKEEKAGVEVEKAISQIEQKISEQIANKDLNQKSLDGILAKGNWGSNAKLAVSAAFFKLANRDVKFDHHPKLMILIFEGESHGNPNFTIQEFMIVVEKVERGLDFYKKVGEVLRKKNLLDTVGKEGGYSPAGLDNDLSVLNLLTESGAKSIALDVAGNINPPDVNEIIDIVQRYPIVSVEDPFPEGKKNQWKSFFQQAKEIKPEILVVGDDLTVTDKNKIGQAVREKLINAVIIKPNQQGTITAGLEAVKTAKRLNLKTIASHRGESTNDTWIVDFALKAKVDFVKFGAPARGERIAKYNKLI